MNSETTHFGQSDANLAELLTSTETPFTVSEHTVANVGIWFSLDSVLTIYQQILIVLLIETAGCLGNSLIIYIYAKSKQDGLNIFIILLAVLDLMVLILVLPLTPAISIYQQISQILLRIYFNFFTSFATLYLWVLLAIALERFAIVFWPFSGKRAVKPLRGVSLALALSQMVLIAAHSVVASWSMEEFEAVRRILFAIHSAICALVTLGIFLLYPAIIIRILAHSRQMKRSMNNKPTSTALAPYTVR